MSAQQPETHLVGIVLRADRENRRISALTPQGLWHFSHPNPSRKAGVLAKVSASALNPLCLSHFTFNSRERGWGWLQAAQLEELLFFDRDLAGCKTSDERARLIEVLRVTTRLRRLILLSQQPASDSPMLYQLTLFCLRRLLLKTLPFAVLAIFAVKLLMHEGRWPARPECLVCKTIVLGRVTQIGPQGFLCSNCRSKVRFAPDEIEFCGIEIDQLCGIGLRRAWDELAKFEIDSNLGEKIARVAELILLHAN